jgi:hypothetical protein
MLQGVIQRMAQNSSSCKTWCVTIVSAILVVVADKEKVRMAGVAVLPILVFAALDTYYLVLEKRFRRSYEMFVEAWHRRKLVVSDLYTVSPTRGLGKGADWVSAIRSFSVWGFYFPLLLLVGLVAYATTR